MFPIEKTCALCNIFMLTDGNFLKLKTRYHSWCNPCRKAKKKEWDDSNIDYVRKQALNWHYLNYDKCKDRKVKAATEWIKKNPEKYKEYSKKCYENNKPKAFANSAKYRASKRQAVPNWLSSEMQLEIENIFKIAKELTEKTGIPHEVDHIIPLRGKSVSGLHVPWNLQVLTQFENRSKKNFIKE